MEQQNIPIPDLSSEFVFKASRSSGPGGQNVNKVNSRIELRFDIVNSEILSEEQKRILLTKLKSRITSDGILLVVSQEDRSQLKNKEQTILKFREILEKALRPVKKRKQTAPTKASVEKRLQKKKKQGEKKSQRGKITPE